MNKPAIAALLLIAAGATAAVMLKTQDPTYVAPQNAKQETTPLVLTSQPAAGEVVRVFEVEGMCCGGCRPKVHAAAVAVAGVREAAVDQEAGTATLIVREDVDVAALERALTFDKYESHARH
jgi:copper chaperone CopZ